MSQAVYVLQDDKGQRNGGNKAVVNYLPRVSSSVCTTVGFIEGRIVQDNKGQIHGENKALDNKSPVGWLRQCIYYSVSSSVDVLYYCITLLQRELCKMIKAKEGGGGSEH